MKVREANDSQTELTIKIHFFLISYVLQKLSGNVYIQDKYIQSTYHVYYEIKLNYE